MPVRGSSAPREVDTLVVGAGQAGLVQSYWLTRHGVEHVLLEQRSTLDGAWPDRWDSFYPNTPTFSLGLPGMPYDGQDPDGFIPRDAVVGFIRNYAARIAAPVRLETTVTRIGPDGGAG